MFAGSTSEYPAEGAIFLDHALAELLEERFAVSRSDAGYYLLYERLPGLETLG
jgi:hypothetical protein